MYTLPNLPPSVAREVYARLCALFPPPSSDTPEARADRDETAMAAVAALRPADAFEALFAAQIVGANASAMDSLRLAVQPHQEPKDVHRNRTQAATMMRNMQSGLRMLRREQAEREAAAVRSQPAATQPAINQFPTTSVPNAAAASVQPEAPDDVDPVFTSLADADAYAAIHPGRSLLIRPGAGRRHDTDSADVRVHGIQSNTRPQNQHPSA
jgi:hypothetical protein